MDMLSNIPNTCINWEPLHVTKGPVAHKWKLGWYPYLPISNKDKSYQRLLRRILAYKLSSKWTRRRLSLKDTSNGQIVLTKFVRANLLLPYLVENFKFQHPPIFLVRHPIDICISQKHAFKGGDEPTDNYTIPDCINNERFIEHKEYINQLKTPLEVKVAKWCMHNVPTFENAAALKKALVVFYSDLVSDPKSEMQVILDGLQLGVDSKSILDSIKFNEASMTTTKGHLKSDPDEQLNKNFVRLDMETKDKIQKVFNHFDFQLFNAYSPLPEKQFLASNL